MLSTKESEGIICKNDESTIWYDKRINPVLQKNLRRGRENRIYAVDLYNACVTNVTIKHKQYAITWHVDNVKASHMDPSVNSNV